MAPVVPSHPTITTGFKKPGSSWATGEHSGVDYGSPGIGGAEVRAPWGGTITGASWGSAYGNHVVIDFDKLPDGSPGLWGVIAHMSRVVKSRGRVEMGELIGYVGSTGNSTGDHAHFEIQPQAGWVRGSYRDPMPWVNAGGGGGGAPAGSPVTTDIYSDKLGFGQMDSDSVKELQRLLNGIKLVGGTNLPITGNFLEMTGRELAKWQEQICGDTPDAPGREYLGPAQRARMFPSPPYTVHDRGLPAIASGGGGGGGAPAGSPVTTDIYSDKLGFGQMDSDSVKELQRLLNGIKLVGGTNLPITGNFLEMTGRELAKWQEQICGDTPDAPGREYLGPAQRARMFPSPPYTVHDRGLPAIASGGGGDVGGSGGGGDVAPPPPPPVVDDKPAAPGLIVPGAVWDPVRKNGGGWFTGLRPFKGTAKKITLHTTETDAFPNWEAQQSGIPHLTVDLDGNEVRQHLPFDIAAYTLKGGDYSPNSDAGVNIQIEIVGRAAQSHDWGVVAYARLDALLLWLCDTLDIPYEFPWNFGPAGSSHRVDWPQWERVSGILGHLHVPWNDHWDPGDLDVSRLASADGQEPEEPPAPVGDYVTREEYEADMDRIAAAFGEAGDP